MSGVRRTICLFHDIERGLGHRDVDPGFASDAARRAQTHLDAMLAVERDSGVVVTYCVVGTLLPEVSDAIRAEGHEVAFHSFDHDCERPQLARCRELDATVAGYRPPQGRMTAELTDSNLARHGFSWVAASFDAPLPQRENGIVKIPVLFDDFALYRRHTSYRRWERSALRSIRKHPFIAFGMHDCYAQFWLLRYRMFLEKLLSLGEVVTLGAAADRIACDDGISERWRAS